MRRGASRGIVAIEFALLLLYFTAILIAFLYVGRLAMVGAALDRATTDAARYMATVPVENLRDSTRRAAVLAQTRSVLEQSIASAGIAADDVYVSYNCGTSDCSAVGQFNALETIRVSADFVYTGTWFGGAEITEVGAVSEAGRDN